MNRFLYPAGVRADAEFLTSGGELIMRINQGMDMGREENAEAEEGNAGYGGQGGQGGQGGHGGQGGYGGFGGGEDEEDEEELSRGSSRGIPLTSMSGSSKVEKDMNTAYEPFRHV